MSEILEKIGMPAFRPLPLFQHGRTQTIAAFYMPYNPFLTPTHSHRVPLPDGDVISVIENQPLYWRYSRRIALLVHGLTGSHRSKYVIRVAQQLLEEGYHVFRMDLRGCGKGRGLAKKLYHSGRSEDTRAIIKWLKERFPNQPVTQIGFSLGANITLKMAGEDGENRVGNLDSLVAVSPPLDLHSCVKLIIKRRNKAFNKYFMKGLYRDVNALHKAFPEHYSPIFSKAFNVYEFDDMYTAPRCGYKNALDYYSQCSAKHYVNNITLPTFLLYSNDDPVITRRPFIKLQQKANFDTLITSQGGHVAWLGETEKKFNYRWMDRAIVKWLNWFDLASR